MSVSFIFPRIAKSHEIYAIIVGIPHTIHARVQYIHFSCVRPFQMEKKME